MRELLGRYGGFDFQDGFDFFRVRQDTGRGNNVSQECNRGLPPVTIGHFQLESRWSKAAQHVVDSNQMGGKVVTVDNHVVEVHEA